ncbi:MAG: PQQ-dependent sugar dehydrogenase, partial [Candidatus Moranbacteria bacterium]|nr:PQQ-dependent sugar dehydrogenase [Candidatus Moranbacteria bacterium]
MNKLYISAAVVSILAIGLYSYLSKEKSDPADRDVFPPEDISQEETAEESVFPAERDGERAPAEIIAQDLDIPWEMVFLPDKSLLITERPGNLVRIRPDSREKILISGVAHRGEGGLLGMALDPDFENNKYLYLYMTTAQGGGLSNRVERYVFDLENNSLSERTEIMADIPGAVYHDGGRIAFGP